jgi:hypothetical protein
VPVLSRALKLAARANAILDGKTRKSDSLENVQAAMHAAGIRALADEYLQRLRQLEHFRPQFQSRSLPNLPRDGAVVRRYREDVVRLSLAFALAAISPGKTLDGCTDVIHDDPCVTELFRICMLCQIIDDMLDYAKDRLAGLPTFLTIPLCLPNAIALTGESVRAYSPRMNMTAAFPATVPFRLARRAIAATAMFLVFLCRLRHGRPLASQ